MANGRANVLIVVDDHDLSYAFAETVSAGGDYEVDHAAGGVEAISLLRSKTYRAMFLDVAIPGIDGIGVLKALMTGSTLKRSERVFVFTGMRRGMVMDRAAGVPGADGVIYKPFEPSDIEAALTGNEPAADPDGFLVQPVR